jgi:superoxide dismutase, Cu-Zn family
MFRRLRIFKTGGFMTRSNVPALLIVFLLGCHGYGLANDTDSTNVKITNTNGQKVGEATFTETPNGVLIRLVLPPNPPGVSPGTHALHIHEVGKCESPFKSAGGHFNPLGKKHGYLNKDAGHAGDLPNIHVPEKSSMTMEFMAPQLSLTRGKNALMDADGSALVIHAAEDDYRSDPAGESGDRIACGIVEKASKQR